MEEKWDYCDRSPCKRLLEALGRWIYGDPESGKYVTVVRKANGVNRPTTEEVRYCPFCGTRLEQLELRQGQAVYIPDS